MKALLIAAPLLLCACGGREERPAVEFPAVPDLSAETRRACPPAEQVTGELGDLAAKDAALAIEYARCRARHGTAVGAYDAVQREMRDAAAKADAAESAAKPR